MVVCERVEQCRRGGKGWKDGRREGRRKREGEEREGGREGGKGGRREKGKEVSYGGTEVQRVMGVDN